MKKYDYIIAGMGCAGMSLAMHLIESGLHQNKKILLADRAQKLENDRTWCFWEKDEGLFEQIVSKRWQKLSVYGRSFEKTEDVSPYSYKMIRGDDFYTYCRKHISSHPEFEWVFGDITDIRSASNKAGLCVNHQKFEAPYIFSSVCPQQPKLGTNDYFLLQHFQGFLIQTDEPRFDPENATLMDFRIEQGMDTAFIYVLPLSTCKALVEYTIFSRERFTDDLYPPVLQNYIAEKLSITNYEILEIERGEIPMTNYRFPRRQNNLIFIGTAGGVSKPSTGYTFQFIQNDCQAIVQSLKRGDLRVREPHPLRFRFYDSVLLNILVNQMIAGREIFERLFCLSHIKDVLCFLENQSTIVDELRLISKLQKRIFVKSAVKFIVKSLRLRPRNR